MKHKLSPYLLDVFYLTRKDVSEGRPEDVGRTRPLMLNIRPHRDVLITSAGGVLKTSVGDVLRTLHWDIFTTPSFNVLRTSVGDAPWRYMEDHMGKSIERLLGR